MSGVFGNSKTVLDPLDEKYNPASDANRLAKHYATFYPAYENFGMWYSLAEYERVWPSIAHWPLAKQARYCDAVCYRYSLNHAFIEHQVLLWRDYVKSFEGNIPVQKLTACTVGNAAILKVLNPENQDVTELYEGLIAAIRAVHPQPTINE